MRVLLVVLSEYTVGLTVASCHVVIPYHLESNEYSAVHLIRISRDEDNNLKYRGVRD